METRKVYKSGGSTLVMSLPKRWAEKADIKEGDSIVVHESEGFLTIGASAPVKGDTRAVIRADKLESPEDLGLLMISHYLTGYDEMVVSFDSGRRLEYKKDIREVSAFLMGLEIAEEHEDHVLLEVFLDQERITTLQALKRMYLIIKNMLKDTGDAVENRNAELAKDVITREREVDRLYFLIVRQLKSAVRYTESARRLGLKEQREALGYRLVVKSFERISDHIENTARNFTSIAEEDMGLREVRALISAAVDLLENASSSIFKKDRELASKVIRQLKEVKKRHKTASNMIFASELTREAAIHYKDMLDSTLRIAEYSSDIAEIAINMSVAVP